MKRLIRTEKEAYRLDADKLSRAVSNRTGLVVLTNPHAPSGAISKSKELQEIMRIARDHSFYVLCDEIYAEFDRKAVPTLYSADPEYAIVTTSFTKAYGLGGLKLGVGLANEQLVDELYRDVLNTVGNSPNLVQMIATKLLSENKENLEDHKQKWKTVKRQTEQWLEENGLEFFQSKVGVTLWVKTPARDTYKWTNDHTIPHHNLAAVPGTFFHFKNDYKLERTNTIRLSLGNISPEEPFVTEALNAFKKALEV